VWIGVAGRLAYAMGIFDSMSAAGGPSDDVTEGTGIKILRTPVRAPNANAVCERFLRSVRADPGRPL
jgi:hypothetical protein